MNRGISLLEALIALAVLAIALVPLLSLSTALSQRTLSVKTDHARLGNARNALAIADTINPMIYPSGSIALDPDTTLTWLSTPRGPEVQHGDWRIRTFRVEVTVAARGGATDATWVTDRIGWRKASDR